MILRIVKQCEKTCCTRVLSGGYKGRIGVCDRLCRIFLNEFVSCNCLINQESADTAANNKNSCCACANGNKRSLLISFSSQEPEHRAAVPSVDIAAEPGTVVVAAVPAAEPGTVVPGTVVPVAEPGTVVPAAVPGTVVPAAVPGTVVPAAVPGTVAPVAEPGTVVPVAEPDTVVPAAVPEAAEPVEAVLLDASAVLPSEQRYQLRRRYRSADRLQLYFHTSDIT